MIYDYKVMDSSDKEVSIKEYEGKVLLIVNTATGCGFTPQYEGLQQLYDKYKDQGFEILDFPCNQFFEQAPGTDEEIVQFCKTNFGTTFQTFHKIDVNGVNTHPLYQYLKKQAPRANDDNESETFYSRLKGLGFETKEDEIKWNFTKFLVDRSGKVVERFAPTVTPEKIGAEIEKIL